MKSKYNDMGLQTVIEFKLRYFRYCGYAIPNLYNPVVIYCGKAA